MEHAYFVHCWFTGCAEMEHAYFVHCWFAGCAEMEHAYFVHCWFTGCAEMEHAYFVHCWFAGCAEMEHAYFVHCWFTGCAEMEHAYFQLVKSLIYNRTTTCPTTWTLRHSICCVLSAISASVMWSNLYRREDLSNPTGNYFAKENESNRRTQLRHHNIQNM